MVPLTPGVNSALGLLIADFRYDFSKTFLSRVADAPSQDIERHFMELEQRALKEMLRERIPRDKILFLRTVDMRYLGQGYEIEVPLSGALLNPAGMDRLVEDFHGLHERLYGYKQPQDETEIVYLRLAALGHVAKPSFPPMPKTGAGASGALKGERLVYIHGRFTTTQIYDRQRLKPGNQAEGPAIIEQFDSTTLVLPGQFFEIDALMNILIHTAGR